MENSTVGIIYTQCFSLLKMSSNFSLLKALPPSSRQHLILQLYGYLPHSLHVLNQCLVLERDLEVPFPRLNESSKKAESNLVDGSSDAETDIAEQQDGRGLENNAADTDELATDTKATENVYDEVIALKCEHVKMRVSRAVFYSLMFYFSFSTLYKVILNHLYDYAEPRINSDHTVLIDCEEDRLKQKCHTHTFFNFFLRKAFRALEYNCPRINTFLDSAVMRMGEKPCQIRFITFIEANPCSNTHIIPRSISFRCSGRHDGILLLDS